MPDLDLREQAVALRDLLLEWTDPPGRSASSSVLYDAWEALVRTPARLGQWTADLKELAASAWWAKDEDGVATHLKPARWGAARAHLGQTYASLYGALSQYLAVRPVWRERTWFGMKPVPNAPLGSRAEVAKAREAQLKRAEAERARATEFYRHVLDATLKGLEEAQTRLEGQLENVQRLASHMLLAEEKRLRAGLRPVPSALEASFETLVETRQDLAGYAGPGAGFGALLDRWLGAARPLADRLDRPA